MLFVDGTHLSSQYKGTLLAAIALDANDHLFDIAYSVVGKRIRRVLVFECAI